MCICEQTRTNVAVVWDEYLKLTERKKISTGEYFMKRNWIPGRNKKLVSSS
jgi:hypothetical protein